MFLLVTAHPDDESMFFLPTLYNLVNRDSIKSSSLFSDQHTNTEYHILCLSNGNYDGLGAERTKELKRAANVVSPLIQVTILDIPQLQDGPSERWSEDAIEAEMLNFLESHFSATTISDQQTTCKSDDSKQDDELVIITFDKGGVSGHVNHIDTYNGLVHFYHTYCDKRNHTGSENRLYSQTTKIKLLTLETINNPLKKYVPIIDLFCIFWNYISSTSLDQQRSKQAASNRRTPYIPDKVMTMTQTIISFHMFQPVLVWKAMRAHHTQFVWYRRLFIIFSSYSYTNTLRLIQSNYYSSERERKKEK